MKTKSFILLATCCFFAAYHVKAQAYIPFAKDGKMWTEKSSPSIEPMYSIDSWKMQGDTTINGKLYKKIIMNSQSIDCYVNEDTAQKKVFCRQSWDGYEFLLYDFNLQIGDTLAGSDCLIVVDKTIEYFAGKNRIKITFGTWDSEIWYEGIGSLTQGVFYRKCMTGSLGWLLCYFENDTLLYHNSAVNDSCFVLTGLHDLQANKPFQTYFSDGSLSIKSTNNSSYTFTLYNLIGQIIMEQKANGDLTLNLSTIPKGLYIYNIYSDNSKFRLNDKLMITK